MTWHDAQEATNTHDCSVSGCTGIAYRGDLCEWHINNGTPSQFRSRGALVPTDEQAAAMRKRLDDLDRQVDRLLSERRRLRARLERLEGQPL